MGPEIVFHERAGQPRTCLRGLARYAGKIAQSRLTGRFPSAAEAREWIWKQPIRLDDGTGTTEPGCVPAQRSRIWPKDGLNCWEATAHWLGWHLRNQSDIEVHLFDAYVQGQRHVFPAARYRGDTQPPLPIVLQPPFVAAAKTTVRAGLHQVAQALGPLPAPLQLVRRASFFIDLNPGHFVTELGGDGSRAYRGTLPEPILQRLPPAWRERQFDLWPTASGDLLFLLVDRPFFLGEATAYVIRIPSSALSATSEAREDAHPEGRGNSALPAGAPPANGWDCAAPDRKWINSDVKARSRANAPLNDLLGGVHFVGDKVLRAFGLGSVSDQLATAEGDALPDFALTDDQRKAREAQRKQRTPTPPPPTVPPGAQEADRAREADAAAEAEERRLAEERSAQIAETQRLAAEVYRRNEEARQRTAAQIEQAAERRLAELRREDRARGSAEEDRFGLADDRTPEPGELAPEDGSGELT